MLSNKVVVVTGGCGLIGKGFIRAIAASGGIAIIADVNAEVGEKVKSELSKVGKVDFFPIDITNAASIESAIDAITLSYGKIDALVNNAYPRNKNYGRSFYDVEYADFCENVGLNLGGYFLTSQKFSRYFSEQGYGNIINISSIYGVMAPRFDIYKGTTMTTPVEYAAIKSGLIHLTKYMAQYLKGSGIRVNSLSPGGIFDNQPQSFIDAYKGHCGSKGMLNPKDVDGTLLYLLSDLSKFVNGQNIIVDDGFSI